MQNVKIRWRDRGNWTNDRACVSGAVRERERKEDEQQQQNSNKKPKNPLEYCVWMFLSNMCGYN